MGYFPVFVDLSNRKVLVVGGGRVATRKVKSLLKFTENVTVVAPETTEEIERLAKEGRIKLRKRKFLSSDLKGVFLVIVAVNKENLQRRIFKLCEKRGILCNAVDSPNWCSFIFPSLVVRDSLVVGITTGGKAPAVSKRVRELIEGCIPEDIGKVLEEISEKRKKLPKGERRRRLMTRMVERLIPYG